MADNVMFQYQNGNQRTITAAVTQMLAWERFEEPHQDNCEESHEEKHADFALQNLPNHMKRILLFSSEKGPPCSFRGGRLN